MVTIELTYAEIDCFLSVLPFASDLSVKLAASKITVPKTRLIGGFSKMLRCTEVEARKLLRLAQEQGLSDTVKEIQRSMKSPGL